MRNQLIGGVLALAVLGGWPAPVKAQDAKAAEIMAATRKAIGDKKLEALKTLSVQATLQRNAGNFRMDADVEMLFDMPDKYLRSDTMGMTGSVMSTGFNGDKAILPAGARLTPGGGMVMTMSVGGAATHSPADEKLTPEQLEQINKAQLRTYRQDVSRLMLGWFGSAHPALKATYTYAGEAESADGKAHVINVKDADGFAARLFIDVNSKLPLMVTYQGRAGRVMTAGSPGAFAVGSTASVQVGRGGAAPSPEELAKMREQAKASAEAAPMVEISFFFEDWKEVDGINFPHKISRASEGNTTEEWTITKVKMNPKIDPKKFETK